MVGLRREELHAEGDWDAAMDRAVTSSFDELHQGERLHPAAMDPMGRYLSAREARIRELTARVDQDLGRVGKPKSHRGARRAMVCLSDIDLITGGHPIFRSATEAGRSVGRAPDNACQSAARQGLCGGKRFDFLDKLKGRVVERDGKRFFIAEQKCSEPPRFGEQLLLWPGLRFEPFPRLKPPRHPHRRLAHQDGALFAA